MLEHLRLAKMSFDLWGALSPTGDRAPPGGVAKDDKKQEDPPQNREASAKRSMSQAELESSLYKVNFVVLLKFHLCNFRFSTTGLSPIT